MLKNTAFGTFGGAIAGFCTLLLMGVYSCNHNNGIYDAPSKQATYLLGESCTINTTPERSVEEVREDMEWCMHIHNQYLELGE